MKSVIIIASIFAGSQLMAQDNFYQAAEKNKDAVYHKFSTVIEKGDGTTGLDHYEGDFKINLTKLESGQYSGFELIEVEDGSVDSKANIMEGKDRQFGYPNTTIMMFNSRYDGFMIVGNLLYEITTFDKEGTTFTTIDNIYIKKEDKPAEDGKKKGLKAKMQAKMGPYFSEEVKAVKKTDVFKIGKDYLAKMKALRDGYAMSSKDQADLALFEKMRQDEKDEINAYNEAYKRKPEYHRILQNNANAQVGKDRENFKRLHGTDKDVDNCKYIIKNESSKTFTYAISTEETGTIPPGGQQEFSCYYITFFAEGEHKGKVIRGGGQGARDAVFIYK